MRKKDASVRVLKLTYSALYLAIALVLLCVSATAFLPRQEQAKSAIDQQIQNVQDPNALPTFPQAVPTDTTKAN